MIHQRALGVPGAASGSPRPGPRSTYPYFSGDPPRVAPGATWVLPCTTRLTGENLLRVPLPRGAAGNPQDCEVMLDQSRAIDNRRFRRLLGMLPAALLREVKEKLRTLAEL